MTQVLNEKSKINKQICRVVYTGDKILCENKRNLFLFCGFLLYIMVVALLLDHDAQFFGKQLDFISYTIISIAGFCTGSASIFMSNPHVERFVYTKLEKLVTILILLVLFAQLCFIDIVFGIIIGSLISIIVVVGSVCSIYHFLFWLSNNCPKFSKVNV